MQFPRVIAGLREAEGGLPDVHIGVISTDLGAGSDYGLPDCVGTGDAAALKPIDPMKCADGFCPFIEDIGDLACLDPNPANCRIGNYLGTIEEAFSTMVNVGGNGCEFAEPPAGHATGSGWQCRGK